MRVEDRKLALSEMACLNQKIERRLLERERKENVDEKVET